MTFKAGELSVVEYGCNELLACVRGPQTGHTAPALAPRGVRINTPEEGDVYAPTMGELKVIAYLLDLMTIRVCDLVSNATLATISHDTRIDWLELNPNGANRLIFRDKRRQLYLYDIEQQQRVTLLNYCNYVQWVPDSDVVVAQNRGQLCVWYSINAPDRVTLHEIKGDIEDIERSNGRTCVIVDEGVNMDTAFLNRIHREIMTDADGPWRCQTCKKICSATHQFCGVCGISWHLCADPSYQPPQRQSRSQRSVQWSYANQWTDQDWEDPQWDPQQADQSQWTASPRRRTSSRRRPSKKATKKAAETPKGAKGKGKHASVDQDRIGPPSLPANQVDPPWLQSMTSIAATMPPPMQQNAEDKQLKSLMAVLKKHSDTLPPEVQNMVNEAAIKEGQQQTKQLHAVVAAHGRARKELQQAQLARFQLHNAWRGFLSQAVTQWQGYSAQFLEQEKQMNERVNTAMEALNQAKESLAKAKSTAGVEAKEDTMAISDEEPDKEIAGCTADRIQEGLTNLQSSLEALQTSAEQMVEDEQKALKRPRLDTGQLDSAKPSELPGAASGFG
ncbi:unnamed protein product [Cladocopium goreaui]|uniref:Intraflagellar transport protein 172 homolog n=1 Tax=Cladocopium goreaui TaxID=2562237 RepID=A0A9P1CDX6_9DINO|nr:unnamed protein product [Cladocopium goreaui]